MTAEPAPNAVQVALLVGTLLGDSGLYRGNRSLGSRWVLRLGHAADQREWLEVKRAALDGLQCSAVKVHPAGRGRQAFLTSHSRTLACLAPLAAQFYDVRGRKRVPRALVESAFASSPRVVLTAWFLDDGCYAQPHGGRFGEVRLATHGYTEADVRWLVDFLSGRGFPCRAIAAVVDGRTYWELRFTVDGSRQLIQLIAPGVPASMRHKLPEGASPYDPDFWRIGSAVRFRAPAKVLRGTPPPGPRDVYCLGVEETENFVVNGLVLHNCQPLNLYGATKLCAEKLLIQGNAYGHPRGTMFSVVRYGNVVGSRGSVIPVFAAQRKSGRVTVTDRAMTRFWITLAQGVNFAIRCAT
ncbi:MAG: polysaccharide biosynthesis protein, partial [Terriglobales bacterium]